VPQLAEIFREHRRRLIEKQPPGLCSNLVFPSEGPAQWSESEKAA